MAVGCLWCRLRHSSATRVPGRPIPGAQGPLDLYNAKTMELNQIPTEDCAAISLCAHVHDIVETLQCALSSRYMEVGGTQTVSPDRRMEWSHEGIFRQTS